jgi:hypothetical protein
MRKRADRYVGIGSIRAAVSGRRRLFWMRATFPEGRSNRTSPVRTESTPTIFRHGGGTHAKGTQSAHAALSQSPVLRGSANSLLILGNE